MKHPVHTKFVIANLLFLRQDQIRAALAQPVAAGRLDRVLQNKLTSRTAVLLPEVCLEDSFVNFVPCHLTLVYRLNRTAADLSVKLLFDLPISRHVSCFRQLCAAVL